MRLRRRLAARSGRDLRCDQRSREVKAAFPQHEKRPVPVDVSLERLEKISPGFLDWARRLGSVAP